VNIILNGEPRDVQPGLTVAALLAELKLPTKTVAVELNLDLVPRGDHSRRVLNENDRLEVVTLVGGG
jgi:thiamine biosynthesis protein ThiS